MTISDKHTPPNTPPTTSPIKSAFLAGPATRAGRLAAWLAVLEFVGLVTSAVVANTFERRATGGLGRDVYHAARLAAILLFALSGFGALGLSVRGLRGGDRSAVLWLALVAGLFAAILMIGEFTVLE